MNRAIVFLSCAVLLTPVVGCDDGSDPGTADAGTDMGSAADSGTARDTSPAMDTGAARDTGSTEVPAHCSDGPLDAPLPDCTLPTLPSTGDIRQDCVDRINQFRMECQCLPPLARWRDGEDCADQHARYDHDGAGPHGGFRDGICDNGGRAQNECPGWRSGDQIISGCLQQMWDEGPGEPFSAHGHYINMSSTRYSMVACGFHEGDGIWAVQNFR